MKHGCGLLDVALTDVSEGQIPQDDRLRLVTALEAACGALQDRAGLRAVTEGEIAGALNPSEPVGREKTVGGIGSPHCLELRLSGTKGSWTSPLRQDISLERRMSAWKTDSEGTGASSPPSSNAMRWNWCAPRVPPKCRDVRLMW